MRPTPTDALLGETEIIVDVRAPQGATILKVELYADNSLITTLLDPPYTFLWDAGDSLSSRMLRAKAYASDGTTDSHAVKTRPLRGAQRARVTLVEVYATVRNGGGPYMMDLEKEDFTVLEGGVPQEIAVFSAERKPAHMVLLIDTSASMKREDRIEVARKAAAGFVKELEEGDTAAIVQFNDYPEMLLERTSDKKELEASIEAIEARGGTALYDAIVSSVGLLDGIEGRKAIILLSDGRDESTSGLGPGSTASFEDALQAVLKSETAVYAIGTGDRLEQEYDFHRRRTVGKILRELATRSGGRAYFVKKASKLKDAYGKIEDELRHQYTLAYSPPEKSRETEDGWRTIEVKVSKRNARVTHREGYYAR